MPHLTENVRFPNQNVTQICSTQKTKSPYKLTKHGIKCPTFTITSAETVLQTRFLHADQLLQYNEPFLIDFSISYL